MDDKDRSIVEILQEDGRASFTAIAEELGVSEGTVRNRIRAMKERGEIERFTVELGTEKDAKAIVMVDVETSRPISEIVSEFPEDMDVSEVAGGHDLVVDLSRENTELLNRAIDDMRAVDGVEDTLTFSVLESYSR